MRGALAKSVWIGVIHIRSSITEVAWRGSVRMSRMFPDANRRMRDEVTVSS